MDKIGPALAMLAPLLWDILGNKTSQQTGAGGLW